MIQTVLDIMNVVFLSLSQLVMIVILNQLTAKFGQHTKSSKNSNQNDETTE